MTFSFPQFLLQWLRVRNRLVFVGFFGHISEPGKRGPPWIDGRFMLVTRIIEQPHPTLRAQTEAIILTDRLKRQ